MITQRVLVCGGRDYDDRVYLWYVLDLQHRAKHFDLVITGAARGADALAGEWALGHRLPIERYPANWEKYGTAAGPIRNMLMLLKGKPDLVIAFPGGAGTDDMIRKARKARVSVLTVPGRQG